MGRDMSLSGRIALVTGATSGIGMAITRMLLREGASVLGVGRNEERLAEIAAEPDAAGFAVDIAAPGAAEAAFSAVVEEFGGVDIVCVNAGIYVKGDVWTNTGEEISDLIATNVAGAMNTVRVAIEHLRPHGFGDILVTTSVSGYQVLQSEPVYSGSKHAMKAFVHGVRRQLLASGIRVSSIAPGVVLNELWQRIEPGRSDPERVEEFIDAGKGIRSSDVADAAHFILTRPRHATVRDLVLLPTNQDR